MAIWLACSAVFLLASAGYVWLDAAMVRTAPSGVAPFASRAGLYQSLFAMIQVVLAVLLFVFAPRLANRICAELPPASGDEAKLVAGAGDLYHIGCFLMGIFVLVRAVRPAILGLAAIIGTGRHLAAHEAANLVEGGLLIVLGLSLVFGSRGIAAFIVSLGYDPDTVPGQQFSLRLLMVLVLGCALLLFVLNILVT
jgi:hypothetical protein